MAGHSKWKNIMHKKAKTDAQRAKVFTKIGKEMSVAIKEGGADPNVNIKLRDLIAKAKSFNVPNDNIERVIKKASGGDDINYENIVYEGYGPSGVAVIVECMTDNRNRTSGDMRHYFDKYGGNLGATGCVTYLFSETGVIVINADSIDEDKFMEDTIEAGATDFSREEGEEDGEYVFEVLTEPNQLLNVSASLEKMGYKFLSSEVDKIPSVYVKLESEDDTAKMDKLIELLEDNDDVVNIWHNLEK